MHWWRASGSEGLSQWPPICCLAGPGAAPEFHRRQNELLGISKRGDVYLRTLLIHGARSVLHSLKRHPDRAEGWLARVAARRNPNIAAVALANKNARTVWALLAHGREYQAGYVSKRLGAA